ncbi:MAG: lipopolysaccharide heptosyltransferase family protein [Candidatus Hydrogenedentota bacterium]|nr:MAG: lipopolysaccharide heptosyltransferase family protein [Candidatus Hydrogenedentota bacterium]
MTERPSSPGTFAEVLGLLTSEIRPARNGEATLFHRGQALQSTYDPLREARRKVAAIPEGRIVVVGLGLGYLAEAAADRLEIVLAFEGEEGRFATARPKAHKHLHGKIRFFSDWPLLERELVRLASLHTVLFDPSLDAVPTVKNRLEGLVNATTSPLVLVIHLKTAGDVLRSLAAVQQYKQHHPYTRILFVTEPLYVPIVRWAPGIDGILSVGETPPRVAQRPLVAFNFSGEPAGTSLLEHFNPVFRVGYASTGSGIRLIDDRTPRHAEDLNKIRNHMNRYHLYFTILGLEPRYDPPRLQIPPPTETSVPIPPSPYNVVQLGAGSGADVWTPKRIAPETIGVALERLGGTWYAIGGKDESETASRAGIPEERNLCGKTDWDDLARILSGADFVIGHDSGPVHLAAALGRPTLALFGFTSPILNAPIGPRVGVIQPDMPCAFGGCRVPCPEITCTASYDPEVIVEAARHIRAETLGHFLDTACTIAAKGFRFFYPREHVENRDPLLRFAAEMPSTAPPWDLPLALAAEWAGTRER